MKKFSDIKSVYFLGIGGAGMSPLARFLHRKGIDVQGYDQNPSSLLQKMENEGISILYKDDTSAIPQKIDMVIYTPAIPMDLKLWKALKKKGIPFYKRAEILGSIASEYINIAVAGTHGKTTISTMIAWLLHNSSIGANAILGGVSSNLGENLLIHPVSRLMVTEADEFDHSFLHLSPKIAVVTSIDKDHLDVYGNIDALITSFEEFVSQIQPGGFLLIKKGLKLKSNTHGVRKFRYSLTEKTDFYVSNMRLIGSKYHFDFHSPWGVIKNLILGMPGRINVENAVAALAVSMLLNLEKEEIRKALAQFSGNDRRFDIYTSNKNVYIDDYAHHPKELESLIVSIKELYPDRRILGIFQPHLYSRTRDFHLEFAKSLDKLDKIILLPIYPAREKPIQGVNSALIKKHLLQDSKCEIIEKENLIDYLKNENFDIILTAGAGDIAGLVAEIKKLLK
jgi:UDP-N-acetylmuramate--alanine ligase